MLAICLLVLPVVYAQDYVSGIGQLSSGLTEDVQFNLDVYASTVNVIVSSLNDGPNRTASHCLPVQRFYGVNVRAHCLCSFCY